MAYNMTQIQCIKCSKIFSKNGASDRLHTAECDEVEFISVDNKASILEKLLQFYKKEVKEEDINIQKILLQGLSAFTPDPINLRIFAPSGEGKTYLINKISATFPEDSLIRYVRVLAVPWQNFDNPENTDVLHLHAVRMKG